MPRTARIVVPDCPHHVIQRGNRQQPIFYAVSDRRRYLELLAGHCAEHDVRCLAWCLMSNHVHLVLVPPSADALRAVLSRTHTSYAQRINLREGLSGHLFQGRYASYPMDMAHLMIAVRYVENNPVKAGLVAAAEHWPWSSARAHIDGAGDGLTDLDHAFPVTNWRAYLADGADASARDDAVEAAMRSGRPLGRVVVAGGPLPEPRPRGRPRLNK
ncbi:transposase [Sphingomonas sp.]|uniref:transposase n=1 Tax=Sphingomonas sp. TaxID=28214 RepID=UPI001DEA24C7|nr:transposase [Sphingomonas sp.]MBX9796118.1 transposase [Sphingomonas sp.]